MNSPYHIPAPPSHQYSRHYSCSGERKHFSGVGYARCLLNKDHKGFCCWEDQYPHTEYCWIPSIGDKVRVAYPEASTTEGMVGKIGLVINSFTTTNSGCGRIVFIRFFKLFQDDTWAFWGRELELIEAKR